MSQLTYGQECSRLRDRLKASNSDAWVTDRMLYSLLTPWLRQTIKELDAKNKLMAFNSIFSSLDIVPLIEVDRVEASCVGLNSGFTFMRTKDPVGELFMEGYWGTMIRAVTSIDSSQQFQPISSSGYSNIAAAKDFKYNKTLYYWYLNDFLYFPNITWKAVRIEAITEGDISKYKCDSDEKCLPKQEQSFNVPDYLLARAESLLFQSLGITLQIPADHSPDGVTNMQ